jgi:hypothetical protein
VSVNKLTHPSPLGWPALIVEGMATRNTAGLDPPGGGGVGLAAWMVKTALAVVLAAMDVKAFAFTVAEVVRRTGAL